MECREIIMDWQSNFNYRPLGNGRWDLFDSVDWLGEGLKNKYSATQPFRIGQWRNR